MGGVSGRLADGTSRPPRAARVSKSTGVPPLDQGHGGAALAEAAVRVALRLTDAVGQPAYAFLDLPEGHGGEGQTERPLAAAVAEEGITRRESDPALEGAGQERRGIEPLGQLEQQREPALGLRPPHALSHAAAEGGQERVAPPRVLAVRARLVTVEEPLAAEVVDGGLDERARMDVGQLLGHLEPLDQLGRGHDPAETETREEHLGKGAEVDHLPRDIRRLERHRRPLAVEERAVKAVLDDGQAVARGHVQQPGPRRRGRGGARRGGEGGARWDGARWAGSRGAGAPAARAASPGGPPTARRPPSAPAGAARRRRGRPAWREGKTAARWPRSRRGRAACARRDRSPVACR